MNVLASMMKNRAGLAAVLGLCLAWPGIGFAQHGVIREYAALAPKPGAVALTPLFDAPLTDVSITLGPDRAYYLTGTAVEQETGRAQSVVDIWRSPDMKAWTKIRALELGPAMFRSPEIHFLKSAFWLTLGREGGGTELLKFDTADLAQSKFIRAQITVDGADPSLFLDDDGTFYWVMGPGQIARLKSNPLEGLAAKPVNVSLTIAGGGKEQSVTGRHGAFLAKINGKYHLFVSGRLKSNGLGRTGVPEGVDDALVATSDKPDSGFSQFYVAFPHAGQTTLFRDAAGAWWAAYSGNDARAVVRGKPAAFKIEIVPAVEPVWPIGFSGVETPRRFAAGFLLRPDTSFIYENAAGFANPIPLDKVPGQSADLPWIRDTFIYRAPDGIFYLTGTSGNMDGVNLWRSTDLKHFDFVKQIWAPGDQTNLWYNNNLTRHIWAPEIHFLNGNWWIPFCINAGDRGRNGLLKSSSPGIEGPFEPAFTENKGVDQRIDASLFQDDDGSVYYVWQDGWIRKLNAAMNGFEGDAWQIMPTDKQRVGNEGAILVKIGKWYVLTAAEWCGGGARSDGTYDMMYSVAKNVKGPFCPRRVAMAHAGHGVLFKDQAGRWNASLFGNDRTAPFRGLPGFVPVKLTETENDLVIAPDIR